jgi:hypothetical protein
MPGRIVAQGDAWTTAKLQQCFDSIRARVRKAGIELDKDCCCYLLRHTYAKRALSGYWNKKYATIEHLAKLMGNTENSCRMYADWGISRF